MRLKSIIFLSICFLLILGITFPASAVIKTVYQSSRPIDISTKIGGTTTLYFSTETKKIILGNTGSFGLSQDNVEKDTIVIAPKPDSPGANTNLTIITKDNKVYVFNLIESSNKERYDFVYVKPKDKIPHNTLIKIIKQKRLNIDSDLAEYVTIYNINEDFTVKSDIFNIKMVKGAVIENVDETAYWIRIINTLDQEYVINKIKIKGKDLVALGTGNNRTKLPVKGYMDFYIFTEGRGIDNNLTFDIFANGKEYTISLKDIPFIQNNITVYEY